VSTRSVKNSTKPSRIMNAVSKHVLERIEMYNRRIEEMVKEETNSGHKAREVQIG